MTLIMIQPGTRHSTQHTTDPLSAQRTIHPHQQPLAARSRPASSQLPWMPQVRDHSGHSPASGAASRKAKRTC
ncbi:hypothetical protein [Ectopseudomonas oleovorans]|uniref:hypothetical protein n=1 Tax=Ectopseudomonas oleovorans TaxID=301 RepID=UPI001FC982CC|nr:hypothetical protein [Pseudomonas indoloxydans]